MFSGLPGVGKTTLARRVADAIGATFLRIDHRRRVQSRVPDLAGHVVPTWEAVGARAWQQLVDEHLLVENLGDPQAHVQRILEWRGAT